MDKSQTTADWFCSSAGRKDSPMWSEKIENFIFKAKQKSLSSWNFIWQPCSTHGSFVLPVKCSPWSETTGFCYSPVNYELTLFKPIQSHFGRNRTALAEYRSSRYRPLGFGQGLVSAERGTIFVWCSSLDSPGYRSDLKCQPYLHQSDHRGLFWRKGHVQL